MKHRYTVVLLVFFIVVGAVVTVVLFPRLENRPSVFRMNSEAEKKTVPPLLATPWRQGRDEWVDKVEAIHGFTEDRVLSELGEPNQTWEYPVDEAQGEFRIELRNTYPYGGWRSRGVRILEWQWHYRKFRFAVWFHKIEGRWVVLNTCRWREGIAF